MLTRKNIGLSLLASLGIIILSFSLLGCPNIQSNQTSAETGKPVETSWNILFKPGISMNEKYQTIDLVQQAIIGFYQNDPTLRIDPPTWCPCDPDLININFRVLNGAGKSKTSAPPPKTGTATGNFANLISISNNNIVTDPFKKDANDNVAINPNASPNPISGKVTIDSSKEVDNNRILAIIDAGINPQLFDAAISNLLWKDSTRPTLYNFLPGENTANLTNYGKIQHGSAVTAIAIKAMKEAKKYPSIMILKALDSNDVGSTFTISCALSYAAQNNATVINASLGYYGAEDSILRHYVLLTQRNTDKPAQLFFAAGNVINPAVHNPSDLCNDKIISTNQLNKNNLFYPACFSNEIAQNNITTVTQVRLPGLPCYYQNFSNDYVTLGIYAPGNCCAIPVDFTNDKQYYEGTSFATPVASGLKITTLLNNNSQADADTEWRVLIKNSQQKIATKNGSYIIYKP